MTAAKTSSSRTRSQPAPSSDPVVPTEEAQKQAPLFARPETGKDAASTAEYIASMTAELAGIAGIAKLDMLTYFLNMARLEAEFHMRRRR